MNSITTSLPPSPIGQQGSAIAAGVRLRLARTGAAVWRALEAVGRYRAQRHVLAFADQCEGLQPELAKELRAACRQGPLA